MFCSSTSVRRSPSTSARGTHIDDDLISNIKNAYAGPVELVDGLVVLLVVLDAAPVVRDGAFGEPMLVLRGHS